LKGSSADVQGQIETGLFAVEMTDDCPHPGVEFRAVTVEIGRMKLFPSSRSSAAAESARPILQIPLSVAATSSRSRAHLTMA